jgi:hypothetical protein
MPIVHLGFLANLGNTFVAFGNFLLALAGLF